MNIKTAKYKEAFMAGYNAVSIHSLLNNSITDLMLTRDAPITGYNEFYKHCLVSINGYYHLTDTNGDDGIVVYNGASSLKIANQCQIGIYNFKDISSIELLPITTDMIYKQDLDEPYSSSAFIKLNKDLTNKTLLLSLGGYLHTIDQITVSIVGSDIIKINFSNYPILDRFYESVNYLNLSSMNLNTTDKNPLQISIEELSSDERLLAYMTLSQSFFVILDTPEIFVNRQYIKKSNSYGRYVSYIRPLYPLVTNLGRHPEYNYHIEDGYYSINVPDNTTQNKIYNIINPLNLTKDDTLPNAPEDFGTAYFLEISKEF